MSVSIGASGVDPREYRLKSYFKSAVYREADGVGTWMDSMKLDVIWYCANDKRDEMPEHLECLLEDGPDIEEVLDDE